MSKIPTMNFSTVKAVHNLVQEPDNVKVIAEDETIIGGLIVLLDNDDKDLVVLVLQTLHKMIENPELRPAMRDFMGMLEQLKKLQASPYGIISELSGSLFTILWNTGLPPPPQAPLREKSNMTRSGPPPTNVNKKGGSVRRRSSMCVRGGINKAGKVVILQIKGMHDKEDMEVCRNMLLKVKGVISITFDFRKKRCILRAKHDLRVEVLAHAVSRTQTMCAEQVVKDDDGNEVFISFGASPEANKENEEMPDYPDEESPVKGEADVARLGAVDEANTSGGWGGGLFRSVGNFISTSFYW